MTNLKKFVEDAVNGASRVFEAEGAVMAMYHAVKSDGSERVFPAPFAPDKETSIKAARAYLKEIDAVRVAYIDEAWLMKVDKPTKRQIEKFDREGIRNQPGRVEALVVLGEDKDEGLLQAYRRINRNGKKARLGAVEFSPTESPSSMEGRLIGLLPVKGSKQ